MKARAAHIAAEEVNDAEIVPQVERAREGDAQLLVQLPRHREIACATNNALEIKTRGGCSLEVSNVKRENFSQRSHCFGAAWLQKVVSFQSISNKVQNAPEQQRRVRAALPARSAPTRAGEAADPS